MLKAKKSTQGQVETKLTVRDNKTKRDTHHEEETKQLTEKATGSFIGTVRVVVPVKLSYDFQSIGIEVGVELPWNLPPGDKDEVKKAFAFAHGIIEEEIAERVHGLRETLQRLSSKR